MNKKKWFETTKKVFSTKIGFKVILISRESNKFKVTIISQVRKINLKKMA